MDKPITVVREELVRDLANVLNTSGLPAFVMRDVLKSLMDEADMAAKRQYEQDLQAWEQANLEEGDDLSTN